MLITRDQVLAALSRHVGRDQGARVDELVYEITGRVGRSGHLERHVRRLVSELREEGSHICAHPSKGYFMAKNRDELERYYIAFLKSRAMHSLVLISRATNIALPDLLGQLRLPT